jgi:tricorn protease
MTSFRTDLQAIKGKVLYNRQPRTGSGEEKSVIFCFDLVEREEKTVLDETGAFEVTADGRKMLVAQKDKYAILEIKAAKKFEKPIVTADMEAPLDPRAEWRQMFADA